MNIFLTFSLILLCWAANVASAQEPARPASPDQPVSAPAKPPKSTAQAEAGEPRANTSRPASAQSEAGEPRAGGSRPPAAAARSGAGAGQKAPGAIDRLELGTATVTGDREQPKVMYIVPWKKSDIGDLAGKPLNSLVDEILAPVDRDVFKREVVYYKAVQADKSHNGAPGHPSDQGEK
jgi:predicted lipid-binding transport protein (Tim44 family)